MAWVLGVPLPMFLQNIYSVYIKYTLEMWPLFQLTHDKPACHLDGGVGQAPVPFLPQNVLRFHTHLFAS